MASERGLSSDSERVETDTISEVKSEYPSDVSLMINVSARYIAVGKVTGKRYEWPRGGSILSVDGLDAPYFLSRVQARSCCAGTEGQHVFTLVEEI